jgi:hypothetical protein
MRSARLALLLVVAGLMAAAPARAVIGETLAEIQKRFGRPDPELQQGSKRNVVVWAIETRQDDRIAYTVTFNGQGRSIAEGLKPIRRALLTDDLAQNFVEDQLAIRASAASTRTPKPGEKYIFAQQEFTCGANEAVWVDETADLMIVWVKGRQPLVMAVRAEMLRKP